MTEIVTIACGNANAYLLCGTEGGILIDTGTDRYRDKVLNACHGRFVKLILLTHAHVDHCQNAAFLADKLDCPVGVGVEDVPLLRDRLTRTVYGHGPIGAVYALASNRVITSQRIPPVTPSVILTDGMSLRGYGLQGKALAMPGHTAGSVGVLLDTGELFVGDAMQNIGAPACAWCYEDREEAQRSVEVIRGIKAKAIYFGHGRPKVLR